MGVRASHTAQVVLKDCRIPAENRLSGEPGSPTYITGLVALKMLEASRPSVAAAIGFKLADMAMEIDAARFLTWRAAWMVKNKMPFRLGEGSMAKLSAGDAAVWKPYKSWEAMAIPRIIR